MPFGNSTGETTSPSSLLTGIVISTPQRYALFYTPQSLFPQLVMHFPATLTSEELLKAGIRSSVIKVKNSPPLPFLLTNKIIFLNIIYISGPEKTSRNENDLNDHDRDDH